ncbi:ARM repeat superfamily protein isoform X4 [Tasmannia lanceolata]|uniref:ARM repeat superfamily protein isoform X4 n=1 Tax=Tasmannia lanceolata TaxID=3420 RepID=UPI004064A6D3
MAQSLELLLIQFLMPDNDARRQAEEQIKRLAKDPQVIPALVHHMRTAKTPNVRQLSAVLLRKKITGHWAKLSPQLRQSVKSALIDSITLEHSSLVRRACANVVSIIAKYAVPAGEWPDLLPFLFQCSQSVQEDHREVALILFSSLTETIGNTFQPHFMDLQSLLLKCLQDETSTRVRVAALKAVGSFLEFVQDGAEVVKFREFIPSILNVSKQCLANGEEDVAAIAFEIFDELIESPAPLLGESVRSIVQFSLEVCSSQNLELNTRHQAIQIISWLAKYKSNSLKKHKLVVPILQVMCPSLAESHGDEDDDLAIDRAAAEVIDTMAVNLSKHVFLPVFEFASLSIHSINPKYREASVTALGVISEGCFELMKDKLEPILHMVLGALKDPEQMIRGAASFALGQFAEHLQPDIVSHYESVLPCILNALEDASEEVKEKSYYALAAFCENMGEEILPYIDPLMGRLLGALQNSPRNMQETCMSAIGSVAAAAEQAFIPYAEKVLELMKAFMVVTKDEDLRSRARATELVGIIAMAIGRMRMEPILPPFIEAAISGFALDFSELREYTHGFFSNVAEIMDDGFAQYLPHVVPLAFSSCNLDDGSAVDIDESDGDDNINGFGGVSSDEDTHDEPRVRNISIRTGVLDEKAAATQAIGMFALHTKGSYAPYLEESLKVLVRHAGYFHEDVRLQAIIGLKHILTATLVIATGVNEEVVAKKKEVLDTVLNIYIKTMTEDDDKEVVAQACMDTADIIKDCGYMAIEPYMPRLVEATLELLRENSACQQTESDSDIEDDAEHDEVLMDAVSDLLPAFAKSMGSHFEPIFAKMFEPLMKFAKGSRPPQDRTMVVACLAEVAQEMGAPIAGYVDRNMPFFRK